MDDKLRESCWRIVQLLDARKVQKENLTTSILRDYLKVTNRMDGIIAENNKLRETTAENARLWAQVQGCQALADEKCRVFLERAERAELAHERLTLAQIELNREIDYLKNNYKACLNREAELLKHKIMAASRKGAS